MLGRASNVRGHVRLFGHGCPTYSRGFPPYGRRCPINLGHGCPVDGGTPEPRNRSLRKGRGLSRSPAHGLRSARHGVSPYPACVEDV